MKIARHILCVLLLSFLLAQSAAARPYRINPPSGVIRYAEKEEKSIAITFDDGPHPVYTDQILAILKKYDAKATFFEVGVNVTYYPEVTQRVKAGGHEIGNHTFSHADLSKKSQAEIEDEIQKQAQTLLDECGEEPVYFRPPCGCCRNDVLKAAESLGMQIILWSIDTRDWARTPADHIAEDILNTVKPGDIILFHDSVSFSNSPTPQALEKILPVLQKRGFSFVTVTQLLNRE